MKDRKKIWYIIIGLLAAGCCTILVLTVIGVSTLGIFSSRRTVKASPFPLAEQVQQLEIEPTRLTMSATASPDADASETPFLSDAGLSTPTPLVHTNPEAGTLSTAQSVLLTLKEMDIPPNDLRDLAARLQGIKGIPKVLEDPPPNRALGDSETFWVTNVDSNNQFQVIAVLRYVTEHTYFWIGEDVKYAQADLRRLAETFENEIYPLTSGFFGSEWSPGIDNDPRIYILFVGGLGRSLGGYFSSTDAVHPLAHEYSNAHEMFVFNADNINLYSEYTYTILAHEYQHMIQWNVDRNESTWLNEGFSELAAMLNGYTTGGKDMVYAMVPDTPLINWPAEVGDATANYGASFLFVTYFYDRFGEALTQALASHPDNGLHSVDSILAENDVIDAQTGKNLTGDDVFQDWAAALYIGDKALLDGRYGYQSYAAAPRAEDTEWLSTCDGDWEERSVYQYGTDYIRISCPGKYTLEIEGVDEVGVVPVDAHSGDMMWWSNRGDESDMILTRQFDLSDVSEEVELQYWTWYDLEKDYDYVFVEASENGEDWEILKTPGGTDADPTGNSYGWAYNGESKGWVEEWVDLSAYAGGKVWVRFEYVTDAAVNGEGFLLDDMRVDAIGYHEDFEDGAGGWEGEGFVRIANRLPQEYGLSLIFKKKAGMEVERVRMDETNRFSYELEMGEEIDELVIVISGLARYTNEPALYRFRLLP